MFLDCAFLRFAVEGRASLPLDDLEVGEEVVAHMLRQSRGRGEPVPEAVVIDDQFAPEVLKKSVIEEWVSPPLLDVAPVLSEAHLPPTARTVLLSLRRRVSAARLRTPRALSARRPNESWQAYRNAWRSTF